MAIQMKMPLDSQMSRTALLAKYQDYLQKDVSNFSPIEASFIQTVMQQAIDDCCTLWPGLLPPKIELIKTNGRHYGNGVFYTRENRIIIPENELQNQDNELMYQVMIHEVFHLISRRHPVLRKQLYALFGFVLTPESRQYKITDEVLSSRILLNPDGVVRNYAILLPLEGADTVQAIPLLKSVAPTYQASLPAYFNYMDFGLYPLEPAAAGWQLRATPLSPEQMTGFYQQIGDNTDYIIHPDEIVAENFTLLVLRENGKLKRPAKRLSPKGAQLLDSLQARISHWTLSELDQ